MKTASELEKIIIIKDLKIQNKNLEIERLNNIIDKAIEYIEGCGVDESIIDTCENYDVNGIKVLGILKGDNDNEN